jgi:hypothetical protein
MFLVQDDQRFLDGSAPCWQVVLPASPSDHLVWSRFWNVEKLYPFRNALRFAVDGDKVISGRVSHLLDHRCPMAIVRLIIAVHVLSVDGMLWRRLRAHVRKEVLKAIPPAVAYGNAARSVVGIFAIGLNIASLFHFTPRLIFRCAGAMMRSAIGIADQYFIAVLRGNTSATFGGLANVGCRGDLLVPAIAQAPPHRVARVANHRPLNYSEPTELFALQIKRHESSPRNQEWKDTWGSGECP